MTEFGFMIKFGLRPKFGRRTGLQTCLIIALALLLGSCRRSPSFDLKVELQSGESYRLINSTDWSCAADTSLPPDIQKVYINVGRFKITWTGGADLIIERMKFVLRAPTIDNSTFEKEISGVNLWALESKSITTNPVVKSAAGGTEYKTACDLKIGSIPVKNANERQSFFGSGEVIVYGFTKDGTFDVPVSEQANFTFTYINE